MPGVPLRRAYVILRRGNTRVMKAKKRRPRPLRSGGNNISLCQMYQSCRARIAASISKGSLVMYRFVFISWYVTASTSYEHEDDTSAATSMDQKACLVKGRAAGMPLVPSPVSVKTPRREAFVLLI